MKPAVRVHDMGAFSVNDMAECTRVVHRIGASATSMEAAARAMASYLYERTVDRRTDQRACALVRFFKTHAYSELDPGLQDYAGGLLEGRDAPPGMKCLVLLGTAGAEEAWNSRERSERHQAIPLPSPQVVERLPMISQLVRQLGLDVGSVVAPDPAVVMDLRERTCNVFYVANAEHSPYIPAQSEFVKRYGVRSVIGFGGMLPSGNLFAVILFSRVAVSRQRAELFKILAVSVKAAIVPFDGGAVFEPIDAPELQR